MFNLFFLLWLALTFPISALWGWDFESFNSKCKLESWIGSSETWIACIYFQRAYTGTWIGKMPFFLKTCYFRTENTIENSQLPYWVGNLIFFLNIFILSGIFCNPKKQTNFLKLNIKIKPAKKFFQISSHCAKTEFSIWSLCPK
jgi:hypothetical protein